MTSQGRPSRALLRAWLSKPGRTQARLADAVGVKQQTISALLLRYVPSKDLAQLIEAATGIPWKGWFTAKEQAKWKRRLERARSLRKQELSAAA